MFDALSYLYEGKNINRKMTLRTQLKNVKMQDSESIQSYFTRVSQIEAIGDSVKDAELVMTTMNGLPRPCDPFIKGICSRRKITKFSRLWDRPPKKFQKYQKKKQRNNSTIRCFKCQKVGHIARNCPMVRDQIKNERNKRHHANAAEDEEPS